MARRERVIRWRVIEHRRGDELWYTVQTRGRLWWSTARVRYNPEGPSRPWEGWAVERSVEEATLIAERRLRARTAVVRTGEVRDA